MVWVDGQHLRKTNWHPRPWLAKVLGNSCSNQSRKSNPKGDVWWGGTGDPHLQATEEGLTEVYIPQFFPNFRIGLYLYTKPLVSERLASTWVVLDTATTRNCLPIRVCQRRSVGKTCWILHQVWSAICQSKYLLVNQGVLTYLAPVDHLGRGGRRFRLTGGLMPLLTIHLKFSWIPYIWLSKSRWLLLLMNKSKKFSKLQK